MKRLRKSYLAMLLGIPLLVALLAGCHRFHGMSPDEKAEFFAERISGKLDLDSKQEAKLKEVSVLFAATATEMKKERAKDYDFLYAQLKGKSLDQRALLELYEKRKQTFESRLPEIVAKIAELHQTLSDEQKAELLELVEERRERRHGK